MVTTMILLALNTASIQMQLPAGMIEAVCYVESKYNPKALHIDDGAENSVGVCQMHLSTAKWMGYKGDENGLMNPKVNAYYAARYMRYQLRRYDGDYVKAIAAYNAGAYRVDKLGKVRNNGYVQKVLKTWKTYK